MIAKDEAKCLGNGFRLMYDIEVEGEVVDLWSAKKYPLLILPEQSFFAVVKDLLGFPLRDAARG